MLSRSLYPTYRKYRRKALKPEIKVLSRERFVYDVDEIRQYLRDNSCSEIEIDNMVATALQIIANRFNCSVTESQIMAYWQDVQDRAVLPLSPVRAVTKVETQKRDGTFTEITEYDTYGFEQVEVKPHRYSDISSVREGYPLRVTYTAGYFQDSPEMASFRTAVNKIVAELYFQRGTQTDVSNFELPNDVTQILSFAKNY